VSRTVTIEPVARIEGHARVTIELDAAGQVADARVQVAELRGFEAFCAGRPIGEMPALTARICGICPVSHALAAALAGDAILGAEPPPAARLLRRLLQLAQVIESHAVSFFYLSAPDFVVGHEGDPARRNLLGLAEAAPGLARDGVRLRRFGQEVIERVAGQRIHPPFALPGGVARPLEAEARGRILADLPEALAAGERTLAWWEDALASRAEEARSCGSFESLFLALLGSEGELEHAGGTLRLVSARGEVLLDGRDPAGFREIVGEAQEPWSYAKRAYYRPMGHPSGLYRVGPLARLNAATRCGTPRADRALRQFRALGRGAVLSTFHAHLARLVEIVFALERIEELLAEPEILSREVRSPVGRRREEGVGACEAPRGTLFHHYRVGEDGIVSSVDLVVATGQNGLAMDRTVRQIAERWLEGARITPALLNRVEAGVRAFDPCLSCATHSVGQRSVALRLVGPGGRVLDQAPAEP
jgi:NAD-reducing hydrogenase large subunit